MFTETLYQLIKQAAFGAAPASPSGVVVPRTSNWNVKKTRNTLENDQKQSDGIERSFVLGNHMTSAGGDVVYNVDLLGHFIDALCDGVTSAAFDGVYSIDVTNGGSGYTSAPAVVITGAGTGAAAQAVVLGGEVVAIVITNYGTGYATAPTISFTGGGGGTGAAATATVDATKYKHTGTLKIGAPAFYIIEKSPSGSALFRAYFNMVLKKMSFSDTTEGICKFTDEWSGSGKMTKSGTSLDATPSEVTGAPGDYTQLFLLENGTVGGILTELQTDIECSVKERRSPGYLGQAAELRRGAWTVRGSGKAYFNDETFVSKMENSTLTSLRSVIKAPGGIFDRNMPEVLFEFGDWEESDEGVMVPATFRSIKDADANSPIVFTVINSTASY